MPSKEEMKNFSLAIEKITKDREVNYIEAIVWYCSTNGIEIETAAKLIDKPLKAKLTTMASDLNLIAKSKRLPI